MDVSVYQWIGMKSCSLVEIFLNEREEKCKMWWKKEPCGSEGNLHELIFPRLTAVPHTPYLHPSGAPFTRTGEWVARDRSCYVLDG